ncbi:hypothetical protein [Streptomyces puniciscabiei]|uniref:hypothetical protein n=1 Tax=Streptomyces puniciscabiei TaxID=164348 RepID=UPI00378E5B01
MPPTGARRQYQLVEPEKRLVVPGLERAGERELVRRQQLGEEYERFTDRTACSDWARGLCDDTER